MGVERFYSNSDSLEGSEHHHATRVLRMRVGESLELVNGRGDLAIAEILSIGKHSTQLRLKKSSHTPPPPSRIAVGVPLMRPAKLEWVIEKGTELGADAFYLYTADHSEKESLSSHQLERLRMMAISAMKQSDRLYLPALEILPDLPTLLEKEAEFFYGKIDPSAPYFPASSAPFVLFVTGPEKGFSPQEKALLQKKGEGVRLNPHVLRAETAPIAALAIYSSLR